MTSTKIREIDYSRLHEILVNMNPDENWMSKFVDDIKSCNDNIKEYKYFKKVENDIDFSRAVSKCKSSLKLTKNNIESTINSFKNLDDENYKERLRLCNKFIEMDIDTYEKLELLIFVSENVKDIKKWEIEEYQKDHAQLIKVIKSGFIASKITKNKFFNFFSHFQHILIQLPLLFIFVVMCCFLADFVDYNYYIGDFENFIDMLLYATFNGVLLFGMIFSIPSIFLWIFIYGKDMEFINTELLLYDKPNEKDSFKENSKKVLKNTAITNLAINILHKF